MSCPLCQAYLSGNKRKSAFWVSDQVRHTGERGGLVVNDSDSGSRGWGVQAPLGSNRVVSLSKVHLLPKSTGNTQEAVAPSQPD